MIFRAILFLTVLIFAGCVPGGSSTIAPGEKAPEIALRDLEGHPLKLGDFAGKVVLLNFWASWCGPCVSELPAMQRIYNQLKGKGFEIVAVGIDDEESSLSDFKRRYGLTFPIFVDSDSAAKRLYRVTGVPESFILDRAGRFVTILDLDDNRPVVRMTGPRDWDSPTAMARLNAILERK